MLSPDIFFLLVHWIRAGMACLIPQFIPQFLWDFSILGRKTTDNEIGLNPSQHCIVWIPPDVTGLQVGGYLRSLILFGLLTRQRCPLQPSEWTSVFLACS